MTSLFSESRPTAKTIRVLVYPNITYFKDLSKDSHNVTLAAAMQALGVINPNLFFHVITPEKLDILDLPNTTQILMPLPKHAPAMRVHFDVMGFRKIASNFTDIDVVYSHLPEHTHAIHTTLVSMTHHRPRILGYSHWFDFPSVVSWDGGSFLENLSGCLTMDKCYLNTHAQKKQVLDEAKNILVPDLIDALDGIFDVLPPSVPDSSVISKHDFEHAVREKIIVFNHRPEPYKDFPAFLALMRKYRQQRQDFTVWVPLLDVAPEPWIDVTKVGRDGYFAKLRTCAVGYAPKQTYAGWSNSATDGMRNGCPFIFYDADYYREIQPDGNFFTTDDEALQLLDQHLDNPQYRRFQGFKARRRVEMDLTTSSHMKRVNVDLLDRVRALSVRNTPRAQEIIDIVRQAGSITKHDLFAKHLKWGWSIPFTPYRRALMSHPNIYDVVGPEPRYTWVDTP